MCTVVLNIWSATLLKLFNGQDQSIVGPLMLWLSSFLFSGCFTLEEYSVLDVRNRKAFRDVPEHKLERLEKAQANLREELLLKQWLEDNMYTHLLQP